jgi:peptidoglycan/LPS O-acetylase OafA/YrhL
MVKPKVLTRIAYLDYLRIFAFISVLIGHKFTSNITAAIANDKLHATPKLMLEWLIALVHGGGAGVIVFFLVSGYIISQVLSVEQTTSFLIRRVFRIYPLYIVAVLIQIFIQNTWESLSLKTVVLQLLLLGDFFNVPYTLKGVEWTLRVEIIFYGFMAALKYTGFWNERKHFLIFILLITIGLMSQLPAFPYGLFRGYFLIYGPFLFVGVGFWLYEQAWISFGWFFLLIIMVFVNYFYLISCYQPGWLSAQFAILGFLLFTLAYIFRFKFQSTAFILVCSDLTYSVYLFHNWMFDFLKSHLIAIFTLTDSANLFSLALLFAICYLLHRIIERPANKLGRVLLLKVCVLRAGR